MGWSEAKQRAWAEHLVEAAWSVWWGMEPWVRARLVPWDGVGPLLARLGPWKVRELVKRLKDADVRWAAAEALGAMGAAAATPEVLQTLVRRLEDEDAAVREAAAEVLGAWHRQGLRIFWDRSGSFIVRTVKALSQEA